MNLANKTWIAAGFVTVLILCGASGAFTASQLQVVNPEPEPEACKYIPKGSNSWKLCARNVGFIK